MATISDASYSVAVPNRLRVSWGGIFAGAFVFLSSFMLLGSFVLAIGLSGGNRLGSGTLVWEIIVGLLSLLIGGWVTGQWIRGESKLEGVLNGAVLWGLLFVFVVFTGFRIVQTSVNAATGLANLATGTISKALSPTELNRIRADLGLNDVQFRKLQRTFQAKVSAVGPVNLGPTAWWTFFGIIVSLVVALVGSLAGSATSVLPPEPRAMSHEPPARAA